MFNILLVNNATVSAVSRFSLSYFYLCLYFMVLSGLILNKFRLLFITRKLSYRKDDRAMRPIYTGKLLTLILFTLTATKKKPTILCTDFDSERI